MRKHYTVQQKAQIVLEMLKEEKTTGQIAAEYGIHQHQLYRWKTQAVEGLAGLFGKGEKAEQEKQVAQEQKVEALYGVSLRNGKNRTLRIA